MKKPMKYYTIRNQADTESVEILLYGDIGEGGFFSEGVGAKQFAKDLKTLGPIKNLDIRINSPGGSVFEGLAIYNTLDRHAAQKTVYIDGLAASIASVIAMAGDRVIMPENALIMIHDPTGLVVGAAEDMRKMADALDKIKQGLISAYMKKTKMSSQEIADLMSDETWMTADEAIEWGFADEVSEAVKMAASINFDLSKFKNVPKNLIKNSTKRRSNDMDEHEKFLVRDKGEKERTREIAAIGKQLGFVDQALQYIESGSTVDAFRDFVMEEFQKKIVPIGPLDSEFRAPYGTLARETGRQSGPFRSFGEQLIAVFNSGLPQGIIDERLKILNATGMGSQIPSEGGFLVQTDFSTALLERSSKAAILAPKCWHIPIGPDADGVEMPIIEEISRATGSRWGGVQVYRRAEGDTVTAKKPKIGSIELRLEDLMGVCYTTNRQIKDAPSCGAIISRAFEEEMSFRIDDEIVRGTGVGQCLGLLNSPALITVAKETGQTGPTIQYENLLKIWSRCPLRNRMNAEWYYNQEIEPQLFTMGIMLGTGGAPVYLPPGGLSANPYATLLGRPLIPIEQASALGQVGDIIFADLNEYMIIEKGGLDAQQSLHVRFLYDEMTFKFIIRNNGLPLWKGPLTPYKGSSTLSPYVTLALRV